MAGTGSSRREDLEAELLQKVHAAEKAYREASESHKNAIQQAKNSGWKMNADGEQSLYMTAVRERETMEKYLQALKRFTDLVVYGRVPDAQEGGSAGRKPLLSARETEILKLIASGLTTNQVALRLGISFKTVVTHRTRIMEKLQIHEVASLVRYAVREKLIEA